MTISRRTVLAVGAASLLPVMRARAQSGHDWNALAVEDAEAPRIPDFLKDVADQPSVTGPISDYAPFGTKPAKPEEEEIAQLVLDKAPTNCNPIDVALYFLDVGSGKYGDAWRPYVTAWPVRWNPVIVKFFTATSTTPSGDTTAWCAAFVNFCLIQAARGKVLPRDSAEPTYSAASSSFRSWAHKVETGQRPQPGDVVVFRNTSSPSHGHVGFFVAENANGILVLGGNQFEGKPVRHTVNRKRLPKNGSVLEFHSYRTDPQLHA
jgi:uncharacterized protein (TIGR02594 family)